MSDVLHQASALSLALLQRVKRAVAAALPRARSTALLAALAIAFACASAYGGIGYLHFKRLANIERAAAERAERANADLQDALARARDQLAVNQTRSRNDELATEHDRAKTDRAKVERDAAIAERNRAKAERDAAVAERNQTVAERDQLVARVTELEQKLVMLHPKQAARLLATTAPARKPLVVPSFATALDSGADADAAGPAGHQRQVAVAFPETGTTILKNFTAPGWVPSYFSGESRTVR